METQRGEVRTGKKGRYFTREIGRGTHGIKAMELDWKDPEQLQKTH